MHIICPAAHTVELPELSCCQACRAAAQPCAYQSKYLSGLFASLQASVIGGDSPGVRRGVYRCALRAMLRGMQNPDFKRALQEAGAVVAIKVGALHVSTCRDMWSTLGSCMRWVASI